MELTEECVESTVDFQSGVLQDMVSVVVACTCSVLISKPAYYSIVKDTLLNAIANGCITLLLCRLLPTSLGVRELERILECRANPFAVVLVTDLRAVTPSDCFLITEADSFCRLNIGATETDFRPLLGVSSFGGNMSAKARRGWYACSTSMLKH